ncbi:MAG: hypothetical protein E7340_04235 [Clostridiales bacterium]|nr:hypothetical protein [Clostridiales bacterium]
MKSLTKRNIALVVLSVIVALCSLTFAATVKPARATEDGAKPETLQFQVMESAQIRIGQRAEEDAASTSGIRFRVKMDYETASYVKANDGTVTLGFIITPKQLFEARAEGTDENGAAYGKDDYINSISNYVNKKNDGKGVKVDVDKIYVADASDKITPWEGTQDIITKDGEAYYANGVIQGVYESNINVDFTVIAYIFDGTNYEYSVPSADFSRSYTQTATKAYLSGKNSLEAIQKAQHLSDFGAETNPLAITEGQDLYNISEQVAKENTFEGIKFDLKNDVEVDYDFEPVGENFKGEFINNGENAKVVSIVNNKGLESVFVNTVDNVSCVNNTKVFTATAKSFDWLKVGRQAGDVYYDRYLPNSQLPTAGKQVVEYDSDGDGATDAERLEDYTLYGATDMIGEGKSSAIAATLSNADSLRLKLNYTKKELLDMAPVYNAETEVYDKSTSPYGTYNHVKFTYALVRTNTVGTTPTENGTEYTSLFDVLAQEKFFAAPKNVSGAKKIEQNKWRTYMLSIEDFAMAVGNGTDNADVLYIGVFSTMAGGKGGTFEIYISDIELVNDTSTILSMETNHSEAPIITYQTSQVTAPTYDETTNECTVKGTMSMSRTASYKASYCHPSEFPYEGFTNAAFKYQLNNLSNVYVKLRYTQAEIKQRAKAYGYNAISLTYLIQGSGYAPEGVMALEHTTNAWKTIKLPLDTFCTYFGAVSLKPSSDAAFEPIQDYEFATSSAIQEVPQELVQLRCSRTHKIVYMYIGNISFTNI